MVDRLPSYISHNIHIGAYQTLDLRVESRSFIQYNINTKSYFGFDLHRLVLDRSFSTTKVMSRTNLLYSLGVIPVFMGLGHLAPAIGAIHTATGSYRFPGRLFGLIGTISALVDCTY